MDTRNVQLHIEQFHMKEVHKLQWLLHIRQMRKSTLKQVEGTDTHYHHKLHPHQSATESEGNLLLLASSWEAKGLNPTSSSPTLTTSTWEMDPKTLSFENQQGLCPGDPKGWRGKQPALKGLGYRHSCPETHGKSSRLKNAWTMREGVYWLILECLLKVQGCVGTLSGDGVTWRCHICTFLLPC